MSQFKPDFNGFVRTMFVRMGIEKINSLKIPVQWHERRPTILKVVNQSNSVKHPRLVAQGGENAADVFYWGMDYESGSYRLPKPRLTLDGVRLEVLTDMVQDELPIHIGPRYES